jgi:hypothetical protein
MRQYHGLFRLSGAFFRLQFSADYTISMFGFDLRQGQIRTGRLTEIPDFVSLPLTACLSLQTPLHSHR